jgi:hypothetical protein
MKPLNLPGYDFTFREGEDKRTFIYDDLRGKYVRLTPEEWVRQHFARYLVAERGYRRALLSVEHGFRYQGMDRRADLVAWNRQGEARLMVECKAPQVDIQQATFDQVARYNKVVGAEHLAVTNGQEHFCYTVDPAAETFRFLDGIPSFEEG